MIPLALILLASSQRVELVNKLARVPAGQWESVNVTLRQRRPVVVYADFEVREGWQHARLELLRREDLDRMRQGRPNGFLAMTQPAAGGHLRCVVRVPGEYAIVLDNRNSTSQPALARLRVELDFSERPGTTVTQLSPGRQLAVILISFAVFFAIVTFSARRLLRGIQDTRR